MIAIVVEDNYYEIGSASFFSAFFDTIHYHLEDYGNWGSNYPFLLNNFYNGNLIWQDALTVVKELEEIRIRLKAFQPSDVIWDITDLSKRPPWGDDISEDITSLANYFRTSDDAKDLIYVMINALKKGDELKASIEIKDV